MKPIIRAGCFLVIVIAMIVTVHWRTSASNSEPLQAVEVYEQGSAAIVYIRALGEYNNIRSTGSGVIVSKDGELLTAYHVVKNATSFEIVSPEGRVITGAKLVAYDEGKDTALMKLSAPKKGESYPYVLMRKQPLKHGEKVFAIGYPLKDTPMITEGIVNTPAAVINNRERILTSAQIVSGMSGGALFDQKGQLSGVISGSLRSMDGIHLIINIDDVLALYAQAGKK